MVAASNSTDRFQCLPHSLQRLFRLLQRVNFGTLSFDVRRCEPDLERPWRIRRTVKLSGGDNGPRPEAALADFTLCAEQQALAGALQQVADGACVTVEVRYGLPFLVEIETEYQPT